MIGMGKLACLQLLLFSMLCILQRELTIGLTWPVSSSGVKLLGLFPQQAYQEYQNDVWTIHCRLMFKAAIILSQQYNITLQGQYLTYDEIITDNNIVLTVDDICQKVSASNIVGFVGPGHSSEAGYLALLAYQLGILSISYAATSSDLSTIDNGAFFRAVPSDENMILSIIILFQEYKWRSCIIIYQNDEYGYDGMKLLSEKLWKVGIKTPDIIKFDMREQNFQIDLQKTLVNSLSRIVIVWAHEKSTITILNKALEGNLIGPHFVWMLTTTISLDHFNQKQKLIGILVIEPTKGDLVNMSINTTLLNGAYELWKYYEPDTFPGDGNVNSYALFAFDATWGIIRALQELCSVQSSCLEFINGSDCYRYQFANSKQYYNIMKTTEFLGVSGKVKFLNGTSDRVSDAYYVIKNVKPLNRERNIVDYIPVRKWQAGSANWTFYKNKSDYILWPSQSKDTPRDHRSIRGEELRIAIIESPPFIILTNPTATYNGMTGDYKYIEIKEFDGFFKEILDYLQQEMGFKPVIMLAKPTVHYNDLVYGVANDLFDTVMTTLTVTEERSRIVDFSRDIIPSSIRIVIRKPTSFPLNPLFFLQPFSTLVWLLLLAIIPQAGILLWFFERRNSNKRENNGNLSLASAISHIIHILFGRSHPYVVNTRSGKFLIMGLYPSQLIFIAIYTASLLSYITLPNSDFLISGIDDIKNGKIRRDRIGIVAGSQIENFYLTMVTNGKKDYYSLNTTNEVYTRLKDGDIDAALWTNLSIAYHVNNVESYCDSLVVVGVEFSQNSYHFPVKRDWLYKAELDFYLLSLKESQELDRISARWLGRHSCDGANTLDAQRQPIAIKSMIGVFTIHGIITILSILLHFQSNIMNIMYRKIFRIREMP